MNFIELKRKAKESLKGKYGESSKLLLIYFFISFAVSFLISILTPSLNVEVAAILEIVVSLLVSGAIYFGYYSFFLKISRNEEVTYNELFQKTNLLLPCIAISLLVGIFTFLWSLLFIIPGIIASINYYFVFFVALDNPEMKAMEVLRESKRIMYGHKFEFFILSLSFLGWAILGIFTLGILYLWLIPYMWVTYANFYNEIKE